MKNTTKLFFQLLFIVLLQSCEKQDIDGLTNTIPDQNFMDTQFQNEHFGQVAKGSFIGLVRNKAGMNLEGVQITIGNEMTTTDRNGAFILNDVDVFENFAYIQAKKAGYIDGSRMVIPKREGTNRIEIVLLDKEVTERINSGEFSEVSLPSGAKVTFSGDFVTQNGEAYNGPVDVVMHYVDPNYTTTFTQMPGGLFAQTESNDAVSLETYGMMSVNLFSDSGQELNINQDNPATLKFPIGFSQTSIAPNTINLWYFDEEVGYWKEEGQARKEGNTYVAEVTHFSWWNCDVPFDSVELCFSLSPMNTVVETPYYLLIRRSINDQLIFSGVVQSGDNPECGLIPRNEEVEIQIYNVGITQTCFGQIIHQETIGGFSADTSVEIDFPQTQLTTTTITGTATNCNGNPLTNGYVYVENFFNSSSITNGIIDIGVQHCIDENVIVQVFDADLGQWALVNNVTLTGGTVDIGTLNTCDNTGGIYNGDITLSNQEEVDNFGMFNYVVISGNLHISDGNTGSNITDLTPLSSIETISESLWISGNEDLQSLEGLNAISQVESVYIIGNTILNSLQGLDNLTEINHFSVRFNDGLQTLKGIENVTTMNSLSLTDNSVLNTIEDLSNLSSLNQFYLDNCDSLTTLLGLEQITEAAYIWITNNDGLENLEGLNNLTTLLNSGSFIGLMVGWEATDTIDNIPAPNPNLSDFCALENLMSNGNVQFSQVIIGHNAYNPSISDIANGNCSL